MPFSLVGWAEAAPGNAAVVGVTRAALDSLFTGGNGDYITMRPEVKALLGLFYGVESTPGYIRVKQANQKYPVVKLLGNDIEGGILKPFWSDYRRHPIALKPGEDMIAQTFNATDEDTMIIAAVGTGPIKPDEGDQPKDIFTLRGTVDFTQVALTWTTGAVTWSESLEAGTYKVLGLKGWCYKAANPGYAAIRLLGLKDPNFRPGSIAPLITADKTTILQPEDDVFGYWGEMEGIEFDNTALPSVEALSPYANTDMVLEMMCLKV